MQLTLPPPIDDTLSELRLLLIKEREALKAFDTPAVSVISARITELEEALRENYAATGPRNAEERAALLEIRDLTLRNQVLLVHARACVRGIVACLSQNRIAPLDGPGVRQPDGVRLNVQG